MHRLRSGNPQAGPIFANTLGKPLNMKNLLGRIILPVLNRCAACHKGKAEHLVSDHKYERDGKLPEWHGWHAARVLSYQGTHGMQLAEASVPGETFSRQGRTTPQP